MTGSEVDPKPEDMGVSEVGGPRYRWALLLSAFAVMMIIGIYQYSWFLFAFRIHEELGWDLASLGLVYTIFHSTSTLVMPFSGYVADVYGPRYLASVAAVLVGAGFILCGAFPAQTAVLVFYGIGGIGAGMLYGLSTATAIKWFPDRRGFAVGLAVFGFGAGTAVFNIGIEKSLQAYGLERTFLHVGIFMLATLVPLAQVYRYPDRRAGRRSGPAAKPVAPGTANAGPRQMLGTRAWYVMYLSFSITVSVVLFFGAQLKVLASTYGVPAGYLHALLVLFPVANGLSRLLAGAVSDRIGRVRTMQYFYGVLGFSILALVWLGDEPVLFFLLVILAALVGGAPFALYPAAIGDFYGPRYSSTNYGVTYTAKAWAGLISGWLSGYLVTRFGSFTLPLVSVGICSLLAALASHPGLLKPPALKKEWRS